MTLAQEGYNIMKGMPSKQLKPIIQLHRVMKEKDNENNREQRMKALAEMDELRVRCSKLLPDDFDPEAERAAAMEERYQDLLNGNLIRI